MTRPEQSGALWPSLKAIGPELVVPLLLLGYGSFYYFEVRGLPRPETNLLLIQPVYLILLACCLAFVLGRLYQALNGGKTASLEETGAASDGELRLEALEEAEEERIDLGKSIAFVVLTLFYVGLMDVVGFVVTTLCYLVVLSYVLGVRSWAVLLLVPAGVVALLYFGMKVWLNLPPPDGALF